MGAPCNDWCLLSAEELAAVHRSGQGVTSTQETRQAEDSVDFPQPPVRKYPAAAPSPPPVFPIRPLNVNIILTTNLPPIFKLRGSSVTLILCTFSLQDKPTDLDPRLAGNLFDPTVEDFFVVMAVCNSVVVSTSGSGNTHAGAQNGNVTGLDGASNPDVQGMKYEAESPDEAALVLVCY